jgi:hypothetical protein
LLRRFSAWRSTTRRKSEIYRSALEAIPKGQLEAARSLRVQEGQILRLIRGPQAFRLALAPMTNDFVALLKDSSLVSVLTVMELTKQTGSLRPTSAAGCCPASVRISLPRHVAAALGGGPTAGGAVESADAVNVDSSAGEAHLLATAAGPAVTVADLHLRRGTRQVLAGASLAVARGESSR